MQSVLDAFSVEEVNSTRQIAHALGVAWKKDYRPGITFFTIGVSRIGGIDTIPGPAGVNSRFGQYLFEDDSAYVTGYAYERSLSVPTGGMTKALAEVDLDNTSGRYTPRQMGGTSAIFTANGLPRRPVTISAGFNVSGAPYAIPQFAGITDRPAVLDMRRKSARLQAEDFIGFIQNTIVDKSAMFTYQLSGQVIEDSLSTLGFSTAQYDVDPGVNIIKFGLFETGVTWGNYMQKITEAEGGHLYQDEEGKIRFEDRHHWTNFPHFNVQRVISTGMVLEQKTPDYDHIINVVEVTGTPRELGQTQLIWQSSAYAGAGVITINPGEQVEVWANYNDPVWNVDTPVLGGETSFFLVNAEPDGSGASIVGSVLLKSITTFAQSSKLVFESTSTKIRYITNIDIWGRPARKTGDVYYKGKMGSSITAFEERTLKITNDYIQDGSWAQSLAEMILADYSRPENLQTITIRAIPELQLGDLVSWQGRYWRIWDIKSTINPSVGFIQELSLLQRTIKTYFRIGVSSIGGSDLIAP